MISKKVKKLRPYVAGIQPIGDGWVKLNTNENPYPPSSTVANVIKNFDFARLRLYPDGDSNVLREAISQEFSLGATACCFVGNGSDEILSIALQTFFSGKTNILTPDISYGFYSVWAQMYDIGLTQIPLNHDFSIDVSQYRNGNGVIIANPNAPTSIALSKLEVEEIVKNNPKGVVIVDEAYVDFGAETAIHLTKKYDNLLVVRTFSKSYSCAGLRAGFAVGNSQLISAMITVKNSFNSYPLDMLAQIGVKSALQDEKYFHENLGRIIVTRDKTVKALKDLGMNVLNSSTNFLFVEFDNAKEVYEKLFERKILVRYWDKPRINKFLRVTIGAKEETEAFIQCVKQLQQEKLGKLKLKLP
ncbi:histidinol-phosphate aminotransferase [Endomicrobiia bacterium]|nr:histidinol-phosphate aminotransferase [Endomicrobiia bacterium]